METRSLLPCDRGVYDQLQLAAARPRAQGLTWRRVAAATRIDQFVGKTTAIIPVSQTKQLDNLWSAIETNKDTVAAFVSVPAVGVILVSDASWSSFSASWSSEKTLDIYSAVDVWTVSSAPAIQCTVSSFTNASFGTPVNLSLIPIDAGHAKTRVEQGGVASI